MNINAKLMNIVAEITTATNANNKNFRNQQKNF